MNILQQNKIKIITLILIQALFSMPVFSIDLDCTVDDKIRKNYNVGVPIEKRAPTSQTMPKLPAVPQKINKNSSRLANPTPTKNSVRHEKEKKSFNNNKSRVNKKIYMNKRSFPLRNGMSFDIYNLNAISDRQRVGTNITFAVKKPIKTAYYTIPEGTKLVGRIAESHTPQITGNGGLVSVSVETIILNGSYQHIDARVVKVNGKKVFFEDIKGQRSYMKNTVEKGKWGRRTFNKMNKLSASLAKDKATLLLTPFTFVYGVAAGGVSTVTSPVVAVFSKGGRVYIPPYTTFKIKIEKDVKLYY